MSGALVGEKYALSGGLRHFSVERTHIERQRQRVMQIKNSVDRTKFRFQRNFKTLLLAFAPDLSMVLLEDAIGELEFADCTEPVRRFLFLLIIFICGGVEGEILSNAS